MARHASVSLSHDELDAVALPSATSYTTYGAKQRSLC
eukprot:CAMPEP_0205888174 /NCGR_PEP_ID=MMETSP1083-20121108/20248_1 /ASSEMBLY_ACC=CAM_ASM_000430 /TAXON_ID=97485 /ORGANISM="Prymnesium parvum, Strain Texoma1" /LENGTH=36 /DNA_ID= /DNA_START= /DNA_END= /DNA_ORIENTATION=